MGFFSFLKGGKKKTISLLGSASQSTTTVEAFEAPPEESAPAATLSTVEDSSAVSSSLSREDARGIDAAPVSKRPPSPKPSVDPVTPLEMTSDLLASSPLGLNGGKMLTPVAESHAGSHRDAEDAQCSLSLEEELTPASPPAFSARSLKSEGLSNLDAPLEQVLANVAEAFGPMIASSVQSSKWDKRSTALKAVGSVLKGLDLQGMAKPGSTGVLRDGFQFRDQARAWRTCCQLLSHTMRDKVMPVRIASHELFLDALSLSVGPIPHEEAEATLVVLLGHAIDRLGDSNVRLHESARKCVIAASGNELFGRLGVVERLRVHLDTAGKGREKTKVHYGVLDAVNSVLQPILAGRADIDELSADVFAPFVLAGMDDTLGPRVRDAAGALAVTVRACFGAEKLEPHLNTLRPALQVAIRTKIEEAEQGTEKRPATGGVRRPATGSKTVPPAAGRSNARLPHGVQLPPLAAASPAAMGPMGYFADEEDMLMDDILEEAGMVFNGTDLQGILEIRRNALVGGLGGIFDDMNEEELLMSLALEEEFNRHSMDQLDPMLLQGILQESSIDTGRSGSGAIEVF